MRKELRQIGYIIFAVAVSVSLVNLDDLVSATVPGSNQIVSLRSTGNLANNHSGQPLISADGKVAAYHTEAVNILPTNGKGIFARNLATGSIDRVSMSTAGVISDGNNQLRAISATGRYVLFSSFSSNLIDGNTTPTTYPHLYLRDRTNATTVLVSKTPAGVLSDSGISSVLGVSSDGRFVAYTSNATNLHADSTDGNPHLYLLDRSANSLSIIDRKTDGTVGTTNSSWGPAGAMSCDGAMFAFTYPSNLIVGDTYSNHVDVYLLDRRGDTDRLTNLTKTANSAALGASISCNGDFVGFKSLGTNIDTSVAVNSVYQAYRPYIYDRVNETYHFAAMTASGLATDAAVCGTVLSNTTCIQISDTGLGTFHANDSTLTGDSGTQVYIRDIYAGTTELVSKNSTGVVGNGSSEVPKISASGAMVIYTSGASNLIVGDGNGKNDVFTSLTGH